MHKSRGFRIEALLADQPSHPAAAASPDSSAGSPASCAPPETPPAAPAAFVPKPGLLALPPPAPLSAMQTLYPPPPPPLYPLPPLPSQPPAWLYAAAGFPALAQPGPEHAKAAALAGALPLEHWIRTGLLAPRFPDFHGE